MEDILAAQRKRWAPASNTGVGPPTDPTGGRAAFCHLRDMAERGLDPLLPLRGGRAALCQKRDMAERGLDPLLPGEVGWWVGGWVGWLVGGGT